jgi:hypothetical protein
MQEENVLKTLIDGKVDGERLSIVNLDGGGAVELIDTAIGDAVRNAVDLNMKQKVKREVVIKISITPIDDNRTIAFIDYDVDVKLAKRIPISEGAEYKIRMDGTGPYVKSKHQEQAQIFDNVRTFQGGTK